MTELQTYHRVHVIGIGGAGMGGIAKLLAQMGHTVTGSDLKPGRSMEAAGDLGIETWVGHRPERAVRWDLVVRSSAVPERDPEVTAAVAAGVPVWERPGLLAAITDTMPGVGVTGTHGKTTSTALMVTALQALGRDPTFLVGGEMVDLNTGAHLGDRDLFVLEADEAFGTFLPLRLRALAITNVDVDHLDHYRTRDRLAAAFAEVAERVGGPVVACLDDPGAARLVRAGTAVGYGTDPSSAWRIDGVETGDWEVRFRLTADRLDRPVTVTVPKPGIHVARNAAGVLALLGELGFDVATAARGLSDFGGVRRRFEVRARIGGITVVDDYAHHPAEVAATIAAARQRGSGEVWAVFQPHRFSRTAELAGAFGAPLASADHVIVTEVYPAGEAPVPGVTGKLVSDAAAAAGGDARFVPHLRRAALEVSEAASPGDLILLLGAGDITTMADLIAERLGARR
jgi:UDP-N-acetylmuramate--alanine ligase